MANNFRSRLAAGEKLYGTMITLPCPASAEVLANVGFDWFFIDGEHGPLGITEILAILQAVSHKVACVVRVPEAAEVPIKRVLDIGAHGIIVPQVNTPEQAADVVKWSRYSPQGARGVGLARAQGYGGYFTDYLSSANDQVAVIVQAEHKRSVENIEAIVQVPGIDGIQLGPYDLSASMGKMGQIDDPEVVAAIDRVLSVAKAANIPVGCFGVTPSQVSADVERGCSLVTGSVDTMLLAEAASGFLSKLKG